jgi:hypothetical protein
MTQATTKPMTDLERLRSALETVAELVVVDPVYAPIFARLEAEIALEESALSNSILTRARAITAQSATR